MILSRQHIDMTKGTPWKQILLFAVPLILSNIFQEMYSVVDSAVVSRYVGVNALAAIGDTTWARSCFRRICMDCSASFGIVAASAVGSGNQYKFRKVVTTGFKFGVILSVLTVCIVVPLLPDILTALKIPANIYENAYQYMLIMILAYPLSVTYNMCCAYLRATGESRTTFYAVIASTITNIVLDLFFVRVLLLGVAGAAIATIIAQAVSAMIVFFSVFRREPFKTNKDDWINDTEIIKETSKLWVPMFCNSVGISAGGVIAQSAINATGSIVSGGIDVGVRIYCLLEAAEKAVASGIGVFVSQNMGSEKYTRIKKGVASMNWFIIASCVVMGLYFVFASEPLIMFFMGYTQSPEELSVAVDSAKIYLRVQAFGACLMVPMHFYREAVQAMRHAIYPTIGAILQSIARAVTVAFLPMYLGLVGLCLPDTAAAIVTLPLVIIPYHIFMKRLIQIEKHRKSLW